MSLIFTDKKIRYFKHAGEVNTDAVLDVVRERVLEGGVNRVIVAYETGRSAIKAVEKLRDTEVKIIVVTHYPAYTYTNKSKIPIGLMRPEYRERYKYLVEHGCVIIQGTNPFAPPSRWINWNCRFSADGGSWPFMFSDFMALHHLPLNGLPEPAHRSGSPLVA